MSKAEKILKGKISRLETEIENRNEERLRRSEILEYNYKLKKDLEDLILKMESDEFNNETELENLEWKLLKVKGIM